MPLKPRRAPASPTWLCSGSEKSSSGCPFCCPDRSGSCKLVCWNPWWVQMDVENRCTHDGFRGGGAGRSLEMARLACRAKRAGPPAGAGTSNPSSMNEAAEAGTWSPFAHERVHVRIQCPPRQARLAAQGFGASHHDGAVASGRGGPRPDRCRSVVRRNCGSQCGDELHGLSAWGLRRAPDEHDHGLIYFEQIRSRFGTGSRGISRPSPPVRAQPQPRSVVRSFGPSGARGPTAAVTCPFVRDDNSVL